MTDPDGTRVVLRGRKSRIHGPRRRVVVHDRVHARPPHDPENWREGVVRNLTERDGHAVFTVAPVDDGDSVTASVELTVTLAVRDLVVRRLEADDPVGQRVWFRRHGGTGTGTG